jgi:hypothetical protein
MQQSLTLLSPEVSVRIAQDEPNRSKEITLARTIATNDNIVLGRKGLNDRLVLVAVVIRRLAIVLTESGVDVDISHTS